MKTDLILALVLLALLSGLLSGCVHVGKRDTPAGGAPAKVDLSLIDRLCDEFLPPDWHGPARIEQRGHWVTIVIEAGGLRRGEHGRWTWDWLEYDRRLNIPAAPGVAYRGEGRVRIGRRTEPAQP